MTLIDPASALAEALLSHVSTPPQPERIPAVAVSLVGKHAHGRSVILNEADWRPIAEKFGEHWSITAGRHPYVYTSRAPALRAAGSLATGSILFLARLVARRMFDEMPRAVLFRSGNPLDCRRANLTADPADVASRIVAREPVTVKPYEGP